jgi:hypothetical protein
MIKACLAILTFGWCTATLSQEKPFQCDVLVYGGTPAGLAAACSAADEGRTVALVEPYAFIGGLVTNGLSHTDMRSLESLSGFWWDFNRRVEQLYSKAYGPDSLQLKGSYHGNFGEPKVNLQAFQEMVAERKGITLFLKHTLENVASTRSMPSSIKFAAFRKAGSNTFITLQARVYIDASYEGDLMAKAGVPFEVGREDAAAYGEPLVAKVPAGGDAQVQGYNFRWVMTQVKDNQVPAPQPKGYDRTEFLPLIDMFKSGKLVRVFGVQHANGLTMPAALGEPTSKAIYKVQLPPLPNGKNDINDMSNGVVRLSMPDINDSYPTASNDERAEIIDQHVRYQLGMLYFLQNDQAVPAEMKAEAQSWGFCKDEWPEHNHLPEQLYIREARRMKGLHIFTQKDTRTTPEDIRLPLKADSIAIGDYSHNCHGTGREGTRFAGKHVGEFYERNLPFQIPYGTIVPLQVSNLLVPVACSASHVGFGALRLEPIWTAMGQAAGFAAHLAIKDSGGKVQEVEVSELQALLHQHRAATLYVSDVAPDSSDFAAVQWLGTLGGWHGLLKPVEGKHPNWESTFGQYAKAYPMHEAKLASHLDEATLTRWMQVLPEPVKTEAQNLALTADGRMTRGEALLKLHALAKQ